MTYLLFYFIEGTDAATHLNVPKTCTISETKEVIQAQWSNSCFNGVDFGELELLKVDIPMPLNDLASDIQTLRASEAAEKMGAAKLIEEIWPEQPARGYFHICVRLAHRLESMRQLDQPSFDWNQLHSLLWGKKFHKKSNV